MTKEEFRQNAAISALQAVIEAKDGVILELVAQKEAARLAVGLADTLVEEFYKKEENKPEQVFFHDL